jgi:hypothetical protein
MTGVRWSFEPGKFQAGGLSELVFGSLGERNFANVL